MNWYYHLDGRDGLMRKHTKGYKVNFSFESYTGADIFLTPLDIKLCKDTVGKHIEDGAIMIQVKNGRDFDNSVVDGRMSASINRMRSLDAMPNQCILMPTGIFENVGGQLYIDGYKSMIKWRSYLGVMTSWINKGGVVYPPIRLSEVQWLIDNIAGKAFSNKDPLAKRSRLKVRKLYKEKKSFGEGMTLSGIMDQINKKTPKDDIRHILINIDGISERLLPLIYDKMVKDFGPDNVNMSSFIELLNGDKLLGINGIGVVTNNRIKKQLGFKIDG